MYWSMQARGFRERTRKLAEDLGIVLPAVAFPEPVGGAEIHPGEI